MVMPYNIRFNLLMRPRYLLQTMNIYTTISFLRVLRRKAYPPSKLLLSKDVPFRLSNQRHIRVSGIGVQHAYMKPFTSRQMTIKKRWVSSLQPADLQRVQLSDIRCQILSAKLALDRGNLQINMSDSKGENSIKGETNNIVEEQEFPFVWLRDNCQCPKCFHSEACSRTLPMLHFDINCQPTSFEVSEDRSIITLFWSDGHTSAFKADWLNERAFTPRARALRLINYRGNRVLWDAQDFAKISDTSSSPKNSWRFPYYDIMTKDSSLLEWLQYLENWGVAMIVGAEPKDGQLRKLANRVAFVRRTHYGELYSVHAKEEPSNYSYTSEKLQLHTDLPYYEYKPGVNMLQCLVQWEGPGGENHLVDSFAVAEQMRKEYPKEYAILSNTLVDWTDIGQEPAGDEGAGIADQEKDRRAFHSIFRAPVICEDPEGYVVRVNVSQPQRDSHFCVPLSSVSQWYSAFSLFARLLHSSRYCAIYKLKPGDILTFDNLRVCHGRGAYGSSDEKGLMNTVIERHVQGAFMDWDEVRSRIRTLRKSLNAKLL